MLQAILLNKAGRNISSHEVHWRQLFTASEDSLTSTIFGTLMYLPNKLFWRILLNSCYNCPISIKENKIESIEYWTHWDSENSSNISFIEPDIFIRTSYFDLIIEAKRYDNNQQSKLQWENELKGYLNHYKDEKKQVYLIAVGGISNENVETLQVDNELYCIIKCRWARILKEVKKLKTEIIKNEAKFVHTDSLLAILSDLIIGFRIHGYATGDWFENTNLDFQINKTSLFTLYANKFTYKSINWGFPKLLAFKINNSSLEYFTKQSII